MHRNSRIFMRSNQDKASTNASATSFNRRQFIKGAGFIGMGAGTVLADHVLHSGTAQAAVP
jgi:hypothetical protein